MHEWPLPYSAAQENTSKDVLEDSPIPQKETGLILPTALNSICGTKSMVDTSVPGGGAPFRDTLAFDPSFLGNADSDLLAIQVSRRKPHCQPPQPFWEFTR
ncbi:hypothetical protein R1flu_024347 [Riccia fluitans]|uniref:Uncharacterized protein n=1 Tax=Riccia fluitans TaxID=41844 RepID=A0ABD1XV24_9MARC